MKKKGLIIAGGVLILGVIIAVVCFLFFSGDKKEEPTANLNGTWFVYQYAENMLENEYMVFENDEVADYRDGKSEPFIKSKYTYENNTLALTDVSKKFAVRIISDKNIILVEPDTREWKLVKISDKSNMINEISANDIVGSYDVLMMAGEKKTNEVMTFTENSFKDTRDGQEYLSCSYSIVNGNTLVATDISKEYHIYKDNNYLLLVDKKDGYVWELRAK